jgi:Flp pilus assembly protein TadG
LRERGQAIVELALTLPILMVCAALIVTLSLFGMARLAVENAASEGARYLALTNDETRARSTIAAAARPLTSELLRIEIDPASASDRPRGALVSVIVRYRLSVPFAFAGFDGVDVEGLAARRMEYVP